MSNVYAHIDATMLAVHECLLAWGKGLLDQAGNPLPVCGSVPEVGAGAHLVLLPYQSVLESQAGVPFLPLVPMNKGAGRESIPGPWRMLAQGMTQVLVDDFPKRAAKGPGLGPLDPAPPLDGMPKPIADWYRAQGEPWSAKGRGRLPQISWRQPFSLVIRYAAMVIDPAGESTDIGAQRLRALGVLAGGIRIERYFRATVPPSPVSAELSGLIEAFAAAAPEEIAADMEEAVRLAHEDNETAVGLTPHHDLTDIDAATVMRALRQPMQPAVVFAIRMALGAGPELIGGAIPHLASVTKVPS